MFTLALCGITTNRPGHATGTGHRLNNCNGSTSYPQMCNQNNKSYAQFNWDSPLGSTRSVAKGDVSEQPSKSSPYSSFSNILLFDRDYQNWNHPAPFP